MVDQEADDGRDVRGRTPGIGPERKGTTGAKWSVKGEESTGPSNGKTVANLPVMWE